jgi:hypothetical protein
MAYDIGAITRELQNAFKLFSGAPKITPPTKADVLELDLEDAEDGATNLATPENLAVLVDSLEDFTAALAAERIRLESLAGDLENAIAGILVGVETKEDVEAWDADFSEWRSRLQNYRVQVDKAPPGDRGDVLWSVTAPLLLGFYGGENSEAPQQPIDAVTPFSLANQLRVADAWREERLRLLREDIAEEAKKVVTGIGGGALLGGLALLALIVIVRR